MADAALGPTITTVLLFVVSGGLPARSMTRPRYRARVLLRKLVERCEARGRGCDCGMHARNGGPRP